MTEAILIPLNEYLSYETINLAPDAFNDASIVSETFSNNTCVIKAKKDLTLAIDDEVYILNTHNCVKTKIESIQIEGEDQSVFTSPHDEFEFGLKLSEKPFTSYRVVKA